MKTIAAFVSVALLWATPAADLKLGEVVPDIAMKTMDGKEIKLADFRGEKGQTTVVFFYSENCPSKAKIDDVKKVFDRFNADDSKVKLITIWSYHKDSSDGIKAFAEKNGLKGMMVWDEGHAVADHVGAKKVNTTYVLDKEGRLKYRGGFTSKKECTVEVAAQAATEGKDAPASDGKFAG